MSDTELCYLSATEVVARFRRRELSPVELMRALIARAEAVEPQVNAFADTYFDEALAKASRAEAKYMKGRARALEGLPLAVKDLTAIKGRVTTHGSLIYKDRVDDHTNPAIERLLRAGAILHARSTTPEFGINWVTTSRLHGTTRNPWDTRYTCGGSSGGSAAALAAGTTTLATGSDNAGSLRVPAACCGIIGYRAPYGRIPSDPPFNLEMYSAVGPMTRTVDDCALMQNVMAGPHSLDNAAIRPKLRIPQRLGGIEGWRIAYSLDLGFREIAPEVKSLTLAALDALRSEGAEIEEVELGWTERLTSVTMRYLGLVSSGSPTCDLDEQADMLCDYTRYYLENRPAVSGKALYEAFELANKMQSTLGPILERCHAFICPTNATQAVPAELKPWDTDLAINGKFVMPNYGWVLTHPFNMLGRLPVLAVPSGIDENGLPSGVQIVARAFDDVRAYRVASALERVRPWLDAPERRPSICDV